MSIEIGRGPDFVLTRGQEILSYRFQMVMQFPNQKSETRILTHRSLAMICKEVKSIYGNAAGLKSEREMEIDVSNGQITVEAKNSGIKARIEFIAPREVLLNQPGEIAGNFIALFNLHQIGRKNYF